MNRIYLVIFIILTTTILASVDNGCDHATSSDQKKYANCKKCASTGKEAGKCIECDPEYQFQKISSKKTNDPKMCVPCDPNCEDCSNSKCNSCKPGYGISTDFMCTRCTQSCETCVNNPYNCVSCIEGFDLDKDTSSCNNPNRNWIILGVFSFSLSLLVVFVLCCHFIFDRKVTGIYDEDDQQSVNSLISLSDEQTDNQIYGFKQDEIKKDGLSQEKLEAEQNGEDNVYMRYNN